MAIPESTRVELLWWFGIGELVSLILIVAGIGLLIKDFVVFIYKLNDWQKRKQAAPTAPLQSELGFGLELCDSVACARAVSSSSLPPC